MIAPKFHPYILPNASPVKEILDGVFAKNPGRENFLGFPGFKLLKSKEHMAVHKRLPDLVIKASKLGRDYYEPDQNIYRVRRAHKIQRFIVRNGFRTLVVPEKHLYQHGGIWYVVAPKLPVNLEVSFKSEPGKQHRPLTPEEAKEVALVCREGLLENAQKGHLVRLINNDRVCLIDTEPGSRNFKKNYKKWTWIPGVKSLLKFIVAQVSTERLYLECTRPDSKAEVRKVQNGLISKHLSKLVALCAIPLIIALGALFVAQTPLLILAAQVLTGAAAANGLSAIIQLSGSIYFALWTRSEDGHDGIQN